MRVLLTGSEGYLGTVLAGTLAAAGHQVTGLDTGLFADCTLGPLPPGPVVMRTDVRDVEPAQVAGFDAVLHLAALSNDPLGDLDPVVTFDVNHLASTRLAEMARDAGVRRFLYASTCSVYGASADAGLVTEDAPLAPLTPYAVSKVRVEDDLHALADERFEPVYLRNATAFGFSPRLRADIVANEFVVGAYLTGEVRVRSDGAAWRPLVHVRDIAAAFLACLEAPRDAVFDTAFNVGTHAANLAVSDIADAAAAAVPGSGVAFDGAGGHDPRSYRVDFARIAARLPDFRPEWTVERGLAELAGRCGEYGLTEDVYRTRLTRLARIKQQQSGGRVDATLRPVRAR